MEDEDPVDPIDIVKLTRPVNSTMVGFAVVVGAAVASPTSISSLQTFMGFLTGFFISSFSMVVNDYFDIDTDKVNSPNRPLPSGRVSPKTSLTLAAILLILGLAFALLTVQTIIIAVSFAAIGWSYSSWGKKRGIIGNLMVASSLAVPFLYGATAVEAINEPLVWFLALTSFLAGTAREVIKTVPDIRGDKMKGIQSLAVVYGSSAAFRVGAVLSLMAVLSTALPILAEVVGVVYIWLILIPDTIFSYATYKLLVDQSRQNAVFLKNLTLLGMLTGLVSFIIGGFFRP